MQMILFLPIYFVVCWGNCIDFVAGNGVHDVESVLKAEEASVTRCGYNYSLLWSQEISHSPFAAPPLIADVDADGRLDVVVAPYQDTVSVLIASTGNVIPNTAWPLVTLDRTFHSSPLQFDIDGDGRLDLLFTSSDGELLFYTSAGRIIPERTIQLPGLYIQRDWYTQVISSSHQHIHDFILDAPTRANEVANYVRVDAHVLATPVIADVNNDRRTEEVIIPVSYYFDKQLYRQPEKLATLNALTIDELDNYLAGAVVYLNLTSGEIMFTIHLDLTKVTAEFPGYVLFSPSIVDLDNEGGPLETIVTTRGGLLHMINADGSHRSGFPLNTNTLQGQVLTTDVNNDGHLDLLTVDISGNVVCYDGSGVTMWETEVSGVPVDGGSVGRLSSSEKALFVTTSNGLIHALNITTGRSLQHWPIQVGDGLTAGVTVTKLNTMHNNSDLITLSDDGSLYFLSSDLSCKSHLPIGETSFLSVMSHNIINQSNQRELLIATRDGTLMLFSSAVIDTASKDGTSHQFDVMCASDRNSLDSWNSQINVHINLDASVVTDISTNTFVVELEIIDDISASNQVYTVMVYYGRNLLVTDSFTLRGIYYVVVPSWHIPGHGHLVVTVRNKQGHSMMHVYPVSFHLSALDDLKWLLFAPFIAMTTTLLILYGFPSKDLLPFTQRTTDR